MCLENLRKWITRWSWMFTISVLMIFAKNWTPLVRYLRVFCSSEFYIKSLFMNGNKIVEFSETKG